MSKTQGYFKAGSQWTGNRNGRPKKIYCRDDFTDEIFLERKEDIREVAEKLFMEAKAQKPWAIKLVLEYFLTRPKNSDGEHENDKHSDLLEKLKPLSRHKLEAMQEILLSEDIDEPELKSTVLQF